MNTNKNKQKFFVVYQITNLIDNRIYIGAHSTYNVNDKYMGSSKYLKKDIKELGRENFKKEILYIFDNKEDMMKKEAEIVNREFCHRPDTYNKYLGGGNNFSMSGMISVKDKEGKSSLIYNDDPRWLSGELVGIIKDKVNVKDKEGKFLQVNKNDPRYLSGELVGIKKGKEPWNKNKKGLQEAWNKGISTSEETKKKMKGRIMSDENKENLRKLKKGLKQSEETILKRITTMKLNKLKKLESDHLV